MCLEGNGNPVHVDARFYDQVVVVTWTTDHTENPTWLPDLLLRVCRELEAAVGQPPDVAARSRGAQAFWCAAADFRLNAEFAVAYRDAVIAGGCVWEKR